MLNCFFLSKENARCVKKHTHNICDISKFHNKSKIGWWRGKCRNVFFCLCHFHKQEAISKTFFLFIFFTPCFFLALFAIFFFINTIYFVLIAVEIDNVKIWNTKVNPKIIIKLKAHIKKKSENYRRHHNPILTHTFGLGQEWRNMKVKKSELNPQK